MVIIRHQLSLTEYDFLPFAARRLMESMPRSSTTNIRDPDTATDRRCCAILLAVATLIGLHPISTHDFWWQLSRGRAVVDGTIEPAQSLLVGEATTDGDWLGGVPVYALFSVGGVAALIGLKLLTVWVAGLYLLFFKLRQRNAIGLAIVLLGLLAARHAWEPTPLAFETVAVIVVWSLGCRLQAGVSQGWLAALLITIVAWANTGPFCVLGILVALSSLSQRTRSQESQISIRMVIGIILLVVVGCCLTPRGPATVWDSTRLMIPSLTANAAFLQSTPWRSLTFTIYQPESIAFIVLSIAMFCVLIRRQSPLSFVVAFFAIQTLAWTSQQNLAPVSIWLTLMLLREVQSNDATTSRAFKCEVQSYGVTKALPAGVILLVAAAAVGRWPESTSRAGWGIDPSIDGSAFKDSLRDVETVGCAHCLGIREAGLLCWFEPGGAKPFDTPRSALLSGRLRSHALLNEDLSTGWQIPHRRVDDSWGGWWLPLRERNTTLLVVPTEDTRLVRALEPTIWKPLSLDGASLVFGIAGDPVTSPQIARTMKLREHVDQNAWSYDPVSAAGDESHFDLVGLLTGRPTLRTDIRLAKTFRAMQLNIAALRILHPVLQAEISQTAREEFARNQIELGYNERLTMGQCSLFRSIALSQTMADTDDPELSMKSLNPPAQPDSEVVSTIRKSIDAHLSGDTNRAVNDLTDDDPELVYARYQLLVETGHFDAALDAYQTLVQKFPGSRLSVVGRNAF
ncbi:MAG: hypothetical protein ACI92S_000773 [Planctomycetaceae bacterium]